MLRPAFLIVIGVLAAAGGARAQAGVEGEIRALEAREVAAIMADDVPALETIWDEAFVVNSPNNAVTVGRAAVVGLVRAGVIDYHQFDRTIERVTVQGDVAIAMGAEAVRPKAGPQAGQTLQRRYTNIYQRRGDGWRMIARHANLQPAVGQSLDARPPS